MRVLAFDPGFERLGCAVLERIGGKDVLIHSDCIHTSAQLPFAQRLCLLGDAVVQLIEQYKPDVVALENIFFEKNAKTAMQVSEVRGILCYLAATRTIPLYDYSPLQIKIAVTGYGRSDKAAVAMMVCRLVKLPERKRLDDEIDAIAVGLTCLASVR